MEEQKKQSPAYFHSKTKFLVLLMGMVLTWEIFYDFSKLDYEKLEPFIRNLAAALILLSFLLTLTITILLEREFKKITKS